MPLARCIPVKIPLGGSNTKELALPLVRSKRKSLALQVRRDGVIEVRAPLRAPLRMVEAFVLEQVTWISDRYREHADRTTRVCTFEEGESHLYMGQWYPLRFDGMARASFALTSDAFVCMPVRPSVAKKAMIAWYKRQAVSHMRERVAFWSQQMGLQHRSIQISSAMYTWGSCSAQGDLRFTWRLMMARPEAIDYVVVHELAHTKHHHHGAVFWRLVERYMPDYSVWRDWLNTHHHQLNV